MVEALLLAIEDGPGLEEGGPALLYRRHHLVSPLDVEEGALLADEGGLGQVPPPSPRSAPPPGLRPVAHSDHYPNEASADFLREN